MNLLNIAVMGSTGKMGQSLIQLIVKNHEFKLTGAHEISNNPSIGKDAGYFIGEQTGVLITENLDEVFNESQVVIDFTRPDASLKSIAKASKLNKKIAYVLGTTGFNKTEIESIKSASQDMPICFAPNMSVGVNVLISLIEKAANNLKDYDIEIVEAHHKHKVDAPSGTAIRLGQAAADGAGIDLDTNAVYSRYGREEKRATNEIGFSTIRAGDIVGEHTVIFAGDGERIELTHKATSRLNFASGALTAAKYISNEANGLFDMQDVLNLKK